MTANVKLTFLGTSAAIPSAERNHTAVLLTYQGENILVDCGEGTQRQFRKAKISPTKITKLLITHWHGDHVLGIPGLLQTLAFSDYKKNLKIYGPKGTKKYMKEMLKTFVFVNKIKISVHEIDTGIFFNEEDFYLETEKMLHGIPTLAYSFVKKGKIRIDKKKLEKNKLSQGPHLQKLKEGKDIVYNGKKYKFSDLTYIVDSKKISFILDTKINDNIIPFIKNADVVVFETAFSEDETKIASEHKHMTSKQVAESAKKANVKKIFLTHISERYKKSPKKILNEVKEKFKKAIVVNDLDVYEV